MHTTPAAFLIAGICGLFVMGAASADESIPSVYRGTLQFTATTGRSCYADMVADHDIELVLSRSDGNLIGYFVMTPGYAYAFSVSERGDALSFAPLALHDRASPFFAPRAATIEIGTDRSVVKLQWEPFSDCSASSAALVLHKDAIDGKSRLAFWAERDRLVAASAEARSTRRQMDAVRAGEALLELLLAERGPLSPDTMAAARGLAHSQVAAGNAQRSTDATQRVFDAARDALPPTSRLFHLAANNHAGALGDAGRFRDSLDLFRASFDAREKLVDRLHLHQLDALVWITFLHGRLDDPATARDVAREAYERDTAFYGKGSEKSAESALNLFGQELRMGRPLAALELAEYAYESRLKLHGATAVPTLAALNGIASVNNTWLRRPEAALPLFEQIHGALTSPEHRNSNRARELLVAVTFNLANTQRNLGLQKQAVENAKEAQRLAEEFTRPTDARRYLPAVLLMALHIDLGATAEALRLGESMLADIDKHLPANRSLRVVVFDQLAQVQRDTGNTQAALKLWREAHALAQVAYTPTSIQRLLMTRSFANLLDREGLVAETVARRREVIDGVEDLMLQAAALGDTRASAFAAYAETYRQHARALVELGDAEEALRVAQRTKARLLLESVTLRGAVQGATLDAADQARLRQLDGQRTAAEQRVLSSELSTRSTTEIERNRAVREFNVAVEQLRARHPKFDRLTQIDPVSSTEVRALIEPGALFAEFVVGSTHTIVFLLARDLPLQAHVLGTPPNLNAVIDAFRTALQPDAARGDVRVWALADGSFSASAQRPDGAATPVDDAAPIGAWLTRHLLAPLDATLSKYKRWILALDAGIAHLPFDALPWQERPLGQHVALTITQSLSVFVQGRKLRATPVPSPAATRWLGFGAPDYTELNAGLSQGRNSSPAQLALRAPQRDAGLRNRFAPLPHALSELKSVAALFTGSKLYVGIDATERRLRDMSNSGELARFDILHFAAHATVHPQRASLSALVLGATGVAPEHDGLVTAAEWTELRVASDLVVLSACETALGPRVSGEGVLGLPYALFVAGNRNALLTLWPVADDATARFMRAFFARLVRGESAPDSLAATKRDFASGKFGIREQAPFYWAPFILVGPG